MSYKTHLYSLCRKTNFDKKKHAIQNNCEEECLSLPIIAGFLGHQDTSKLHWFVVGSSATISP